MDSIQLQQPRRSFVSMDSAFAGPPQKSSSSHDHALLAPYPSTRPSSGAIYPSNVQLPQSTVVAVSLPLYASLSSASAPQALYVPVSATPTGTLAASAACDPQPSFAVVSMAGMAESVAATVGPVVSSSFSYRPTFCMTSLSPAASGHPSLPTPEPLALADMCAPAPREPAPLPTQRHHPHTLAPAVFFQDFTPEPKDQESSLSIPHPVHIAGLHSGALAPPSEPGPRSPVSATGSAGFSDPGSMYFAHGFNPLPVLSPEAATRAAPRWSPLEYPAASVALLGHSAAGALSSKPVFHPQTGMDRHQHAVYYGASDSYGKPEHMAQPSYSAPGSFPDLQTYIQQTLKPLPPSTAPHPGFSLAASASIVAANGSYTLHHKPSPSAHAFAQSKQVSEPKKATKKGVRPSTNPSAIRPFACELCTKAFFRRQDLRRHMVTHSDLPKAFACSLCHSRFTRSDALFRHMKTQRCRN